MMVFAVGTFAYNLLFLLHILAIVIAFAPFWARSSPRLIHAGAMVLAGLFGLGLVIEQDYEFSEPWISIAFLLWFLMLGVLFGFLLPLGRRAGRVGGGGESAMTGERAQMFTGMLHLLLLLMLIDMIWKPGL